MARYDLKSFILYTMAWYECQPHHDLLIRSIQETIEQDSGRLYVGMPPRHGKSEAGTVRTIAWHIGRWPERQVVLLCYGAELAAEFSRQIRAIVRDDRFYREVFPGVELDPERSKLLDWKTTAGGGLKSLGVQGGITGHGADFMVIDDPHKEGDAESLLTLDQIYKWYTTAARTRLSPTASIVFIMTRWHPLDLAGRLLSVSGSDVWRQIVLPALAGPDDVLGRAEGEALWPARYNRSKLLALKALDDRFFQALYQNNPRGADDVFFDVSKVEWVGEDDCPSGEAFWTCDLATSRLETADYSVVARWTYFDNCLYLLESHRHRETFSAVRRRILEMADRYVYDKIVFPRESLELLMMKDLRGEIGTGRVKSVAMKGDKHEKALPGQTIVDNCRLRVVANRENDVFVGELASFPQGRFDDCVDAMSVAAHWIGVPNEFGLIMRDGWAQ